MAYSKDGTQKFSMKEKKDYHKQIADSGTKNGKKIGFAERTRHGVLAKNYTDKLQGFMAYSKEDRDRIVRGEQPVGKRNFTSK